MLLERFFNRLITLSISLGFLACTQQPEILMPPERTLHFPSMMAQSKDMLLVAGSGADGKYGDFARFLKLDKKAIASGLKLPEVNPIPWDSVVRSNALIPVEIGEISVSDNFIVFASRGDGRLLVLPKDSNCSSPNSSAESCHQGTTLTLSDSDPASIVTARTAADSEIKLLSYLSSDRIDVVKIDRSKNNALNIEKTVYLAPLLLGKLDAKSLKKRRIITKKLQVVDGRVYVLAEKHPLKSSFITKPKGAFLLSLSVEDVLAQAPLSAEMIKVWDLAESFAILGAQDFFLDEGSEDLLVLGRIPEMLYKIKLSDKQLVETSAVCAGAGSMAINKTQDLIVLPCFTDNRLAVFSYGSLQLLSASKKIGRGPFMALIDEENSLIYCTLYEDGIVVILNHQLDRLGYIFNKAPFGRTGS